MGAALAYAMSAASVEPIPGPASRVLSAILVEKGNPKGITSLADDPEQPTVAVSESQGGAVEMVGVAMVWEAPVELYAPNWEGWLPSGPVMA